jgi:hypothetical protein
MARMKKMSLIALTSMGAWAVAEKTYKPVAGSAAYQHRQMNLKAYAP